MKFQFAFVFILSSNFLFCQDKSIESAQIDTVQKFSVKKAVIYSAVLPGAGQFYNYLGTTKGTKGRNNIFWKVPLFYAAIGASGYFLIKNQSTQLSLKHEYEYRIANPGIISDPKWASYDSLGVLTLYNTYSSRRDLSILTFGIAYLFQVLDAGIGAHFVKFDISDDLTLQIKPKILNKNTAGLGLTFNFR